MTHRTTAISTFEPSDKLTRGAWATLLVLCGALFLDALDVSMMGVALPSIQADLDMSTSSLQWIVSAYVLGYGGFLLLGGRAADLLGRRRVFLIALGVFVVASMLGGFAHDGSLLIATRFVKGMSAAFTAPAGLSIITTSFAQGAARNKAISVYTATGERVGWARVTVAPPVAAVGPGDGAGGSATGSVATANAGSQPGSARRGDLAATGVASGALAALSGAALLLAGLGLVLRRRRRHA